MNIRHRLLSTLPALLMLSMIAACAGSHPKLDGVWECVQPAPASLETRAVKILADGHFAFGRQSVDGSRAYAGGGTYHFDGASYIETVDWHWVPVLVGQTIVFDCALKDGLWYHRATFEAGGERFDIDEVWRRVAEPKPGRE